MSWKLISKKSRCIIGKLWTRWCFGQCRFCDKLLNCVVCLIGRSAPSTWLVPAFAKPSFFVSIATKNTFLILVKPNEVGMASSIFAVQIRSFLEIEMNSLFRQTIAAWYGSTINTWSSVIMSVLHSTNVIAILCSDVSRASFKVNRRIERSKIRMGSNLKGLRCFSRCTARPAKEAP